MTTSKIDDRRLNNGDDAGTGETSGVSGSCVWSDCEFRIGGIRKLERSAKPQTQMTRKLLPSRRPIIEIPMTRTNEIAVTDAWNSAPATWGLGSGA